MGFFSGLGDVVGSVMSGGLSKLVPVALGAIGQNATNQANRDIAQQNVDYQREFAQHGIQWRVQDAAAAGLSPLAALGAAEPGFSPTSQVFESPLSSMGQNLERALVAGESLDDRKARALSLRKSAAEADLVESQAAAARWELMRHVAPANPAVPSVRGRLDLAPSSVDGQDLPSMEFARRQFGDPSAKWTAMLKNKIFLPLGRTWRNLKNVGWRSAVEDIPSIDKYVGSWFGE